MSNFQLVYITIDSKEAATKIAREIVEEGLVASVNILENMTAIYKYQGKIHERKEIIMIAKTTKPMMPHLRERIEEIHPYEIPCILGIPVKEGNQPYLDWVYAATAA
jgi:periplasmic divalent cation tolerance protein